MTNPEENVVNISLRRFPIHKIGRDRIVVLLGKRGTGKSTLIKDICYNVRDIPVGICASPTERRNRFLCNFVAPGFIHNELTGDLIKRAMEKQEERMCLYENRKCRENNFFMLFDDCMYDKSWLKHVATRDLFLNGRHLNIFALITVQYMMDLPTWARQNTDYVFILRDMTPANRKKLYENYVGDLCSYDVFCSLVDQCTANFGCLVVDCATSHTQLSDCLFWYKANPNLEFRMGCAALWTFSEELQRAQQEAAERLQLAQVQQAQQQQQQQQQTPQGAVQAMGSLACGNNNNNGGGEVTNEPPRNSGRNGSKIRIRVVREGAD